MSKIILNQKENIPGTNRQIAVFGGGCFWCTEAVFKMIKGVFKVTSGYAGEDNPGETPSYEKVSSGDTGYAEVVKIEYDANKISYHDLLTVFFATHNPTTRNRQGNDVGSQYRSIIFYADKEQKRQAEDFIEDLENNSFVKVVTELSPLKKFYPAEAYHREYYEKNKGAQYCQVVIEPKLDKVKKEFRELINQA